MNACFCGVRFSFSIPSQEIGMGKRLSEIVSKVGLKLDESHLYSRRVCWLLLIAMNTCCESVWSGLPRSVLAASKCFD